MARWGEIKCTNCVALEERLEAAQRDAKEAEAYAEELEAKLAKVVAMALEDCPFREGTGSYNDWWYKRRVAIEKLIEGTDDELG